MPSSLSLPNDSSTSLGEVAQLDITNEPISSSNSSMELSPVTPPTDPDDDEKQLQGSFQKIRKTSSNIKTKKIFFNRTQIVTGSPPQPPPLADQNLSPKEPIKPQAIVNPMASDTSPVSSGSNANPIGNSVGNQNGISVGNPVPQLSTVQITQPNPEVHNPVPGKKLNKLCKSCYQNSSDHFLKIFILLIFQGLTLVLPMSESSA